MANTKLATACVAVLLAAGLTLGVGWVAARPGSGDASAASPAAAVQPPKKEPDPKAAKPEDKAAKLRKQAAEIANLIAVIQDKITRAVADQENTVDVSALLSELFAIDKDILVQENQAKIQDRVLASAVKENEAAPKLPIEDRDLAGRIHDVPEVLTASERLRRATELLSSLKAKVVPESPVLQAANKEVSEATVALKEAREKVRPRVERELRDELELVYAARLKSAKEQVELVKSRLQQLHERRQQLVARVAAARQREAKRQGLEDELRVLRGIQMEILRQQTIAELGIEGLASVPVRPQGDVAVEGQINELRREVEALRAELQKLKK